MKKIILKILPLALIVTALISLFAAPILAGGGMELEFTANLSASDTEIVAGESVNFTVHVVNIGDYDIDQFEIRTMRGGVIATYGKVENLESADIPFSLKINVTGEFAYQFRVTGIKVSLTETVITNAVTITITAPPAPTPEPAPAPTQQPTPEPTPAPTQQPTPEPTLTPTPEPSPTQTAAATPEPIETAVLAENIENGQSEMQEALTDEQIAGSEPEEKSNTALYIIIGVLGALVVASAIIISLMMRQRRKGNKPDNPNQEN